VTTRALRALLEGAIDYAGLFPPAALPMAEAAANYHAYRQGDDAWALGRFVVPVARLGEFAEAASGLWPHGETAAPWRVSAVLGGGELAAEVEAVAAFNTRHGRSGGIVPDGERGGAWVDTAELRCTRPDDVRAARAAIPRWLETYVEVPVTGDPEPLVRAIADAELKAKVRTGGVTADAFPTAAQVARFMSHCARCRVPFKATAGLHHPLRAEFPLTYEEAAPAGTMFGYVNVLLAAAFMRQGMDEVTAAQLLEERDATAIADLGDAVEWRGRRLAADALRAAHSDFVLAFGSCSFTEPVREGRALGLV
jgi:hypothetical protein